MTNLRIGKASVDPRVAYLCALQPTIYETDKELSEWEQHLLTKNEAATPAYGKYNAAVYALYKAQLPERLKALDIGWLDLDPAIAKEERSLFTDHVHFGDRGNRLMAEALAEPLLEALK